MIYIKDSKILIVEDNIHFSKFMYNYLHKMDLDVTLVGDGISALEIIQSIRPYIVILDLHIPQINGITLLNEIKRSQIQGINVIIVSGERKFLNQIPIENYDIIKKVLWKPVPLQNVYYNVQYLISKQHQEEELVKLKNILKKFEFNKSSKGYTYLMEAFNEIIINPKGIKNIEKLIYPIIAQKHDLNNISRIKWCIIKTLNSMVRFTDNKIIYTYFSRKTNITPKYFMSVIYNTIKYENNNI